MHFARLRTGTTRFLTGAILAGAAVPSLAQTVIMGVHPLFDGLQAGTGVVPMEVSLANTGVDATGFVRVSVGNYSMTYPVELPRGTKKTLITYPDCGDYASTPLTYDLVTNRGRIHQTVEANGVGRSQIVIGAIAENNGDLGFLRSQRDNAAMAPQDVYVRPANAPDRPAGYERLSFLVLGEGSERLSDDAVDAIKTWTLGGGTLIFIGGASAPVLNDPRWSSALPVQNATQKNIEEAPSLEKRYEAEAKPFTAMVGKPVGIATTRANDLIIERPFGLGRSVYLAFNPFENPMNTWGGKTKLFAEIMSPGVLVGPQMVISTVVSATRLDPTGGRYSSSGYYSGSSYPYGYAYEDRLTNNPFRAKLPETSTVLLILACYFVAVVPLNFFILRKFRRGELAWGTAPLLSLGFAGVFFMAAQNLYTAGLSTSTKGLFIIQQGDSAGLVYGHSQLYFPRGGGYDLKLTGVDSLIEDSAEQPYYMNNRDRHSIYEDIEASDTGQIQGKINVPNLAFRELSYLEQTQAKDLFDVRRKPNGHFQVTNNSDYQLVNARLVSGGGSEVIGELKPRETKDCTFDKPEYTGQDLSSRLSRILGRTSGIALTGRLEGMRAGPRVGAEVRDSSGINLAFITNVRSTHKRARDPRTGQVIP
jgi:hypothetical protein